MFNLHNKIYNMDFKRNSALSSVMLIGGTILLSSIGLLITAILYFWTKNAIANALATILPAEFTKITTNIIFGLLALSFLLAIIARWTG